jgi:hypothetical protein
MDKVEFMLQLAVANLYFRTLYMQYSERDSYMSNRLLLESKARKHIPKSTWKRLQDKYWQFDNRKMSLGTDEHLVQLDHLVREKEWLLFKQIIETMSVHTEMV